jgi:hypothetical protein
MLEIEVMVIVAIDVPKARCITSVTGKPWAVNNIKSRGTMVNPPPTPKRPAINPENVPSTT